MASSSTASGKVCLFSFIDSTKPNVKDFQEPEVMMDVYVFDLDQKPYLDLDRNPNPNPNPRLDLIIPVAPALRIEYKYPLAPCVIDSTLYLFAGDSDCMLPKPEWKSVYCHDLSSSSSSDCGGEPVAVSLDRMRLRPPMCGDKLMPYAMPTPDCRKIVVFSTFIYHCVGVKRVDFELYDYVKGTSVELPPLPDVRDDMPENATSLDAYYFIDDSTFVVHPRSRMRIAFAIDLNGDRSWNKVTPPCRHVWGEGFRVGDSCILSMAGLYDKSRGWISAEFPHKPDVKVDDDFADSIRLMMVPVCNQDQNQNPEICTLYVDFDSTSTVYPRVYIDVHEIDHATIFEEDRVNRSPHGPLYLGPTPSRSRRYEFKLSIPYASFHPIVVYAVHRSLASGDHRPSVDETGWDWW